MQILNVVLAGIAVAEIILLGVLITTVFDMIRFAETVVIDEMEDE